MNFFAQTTAADQRWDLAQRRGKGWEGGGGGRVGGYALLVTEKFANVVINSRPSGHIGVTLC